MKEEKNQCDDLLLILSISYLEFMNKKSRKLLS